MNKNLQHNEKKPPKGVRYTSALPSSCPSDFPKLRVTG